MVFEALDPQVGEGRVAVMADAPELVRPVTRLQAHRLGQVLRLGGSAPRAMKDLLAEHQVGFMAGECAAQRVHPDARAAVGTLAFANVVRNYSHCSNVVGLAFAPVCRSAERRQARGAPRV